MNGECFFLSCIFINLATKLNVIVMLWFQINLLFRPIGHSPTNTVKLNFSIRLVHNLGKRQQSGI